MKDGGYGRGGDHTSGTGGGGAGRAGGGDKGSNYTFRDYRSNPNIRGNWNTGGQITGHGSMARGITPVGQPRAPMQRPAIQTPQIAPPPVAAPPTVPPSTFPVPNYPPVPSSRLQNYLMEMTAYNKAKQQQRPAVQGSTHFQNRGPGSGSFMSIDPTADYGNDQFGDSFRGRTTRGDQRGVGGGFGGGGGGGF